MQKSHILLLCSFIAGMTFTLLVLYLASAQAVALTWVMAFAPLWLPIAVIASFAIAYVACLLVPVFAALFRDLVITPKHSPNKHI